MSSLINTLRGYTPLTSTVRQKPWLVLLAIPALLLVFKLPWTPSSDLSGDGWDIIARHKSGERLSRGALKSQGAKSHIRENLRDDRDFLFTMVGAGWNNQVLIIANLIYLAHLSNRIPIIPPFHYNADGREADAAVSEFFDLSQVASYFDTPLVEMHEVRITTSSPERHKLVEYDGEHEQINHVGGSYAQGDKIYAQSIEEDTVGCWSLHESKGEVAGESAVDLYKIHTPYTPVPHSCYLWEDDPNRPGIHQVAELIRNHPNGPPQESLQLIEHSKSIVTPAFWPDKHVTCIDTTFGFVEQLGRYDMGSELRLGVGVWAQVLSKMRFSKGVELMGNDYIKQTLGGDYPYVSVHIRRGDFSPQWHMLTQRHYAHATWTVLEQLRQKHGLIIRHVLVTTDERDEDWLDGLRSYGFRVVDHDKLNTIEKYGRWFEPVLDSYMLSMANGMVGGSDSTMSMLPYRRVIDWNRGMGKLIDPNYRVPDDWDWDWQLN